MNINPISSQTSAQVSQNNQAEAPRSTQGNADLNSTKDAATQVNISQKARELQTQRRQDQEKAAEARKTADNERTKQAQNAAQQQAQKMVDEGKDKLAQKEKQLTTMASEATTSGETIYTKNCAACHKLGLMGAPKVGDQAAWKPLIADGIEPLVTNAINGIGAMPAKGGNSQLTDAEVRAAVEYMVDQSR